MCWNPDAMKTPGEIAQLAQMACIWDVCSSKPGNVSREQDFCDATMSDFLLSAIAIGSALDKAEALRVGEIILQAVDATHRMVSSNTNLGIILLLAPLVKSCQCARSLGEVREKLHTVLQELSVEDAVFAYKAIRMAKPGGMGRVETADIAAQPSITLLQAMQLARERDSIAREYSSDFEISFEIGYPALQAALARGAEFSRAVVQCYLTILSRVPDTLIFRKKDGETAQGVSCRAAAALDRGGVFSPEGESAIKDLDRSLRDPGHTLNPGTTADLTTAVVFLVLLDRYWRFGPGIAGSGLTRIVT